MTCNSPYPLFCTSVFCKLHNSVISKANKKNIAIMDLTLMRIKKGFCLITTGQQSDSKWYQRYIKRYNLKAVKQLCCITRDGQIMNYSAVYMESMYNCILIICSPWCQHVTCVCMCSQKSMPLPPPPPCSSPVEKLVIF